MVYELYDLSEDEIKIVRRSQMKRRGGLQPALFVFR